MPRSRRQHLELAFGVAVLLSPMVYALTLPATEPTQCPTPAATTVPEPEIVVIEVCEQPTVEPAEVEPAEVEPEPEPVPEPVPEVEPEPDPALADPSLRPHVLPVTENGLVLSLDAQPSWGIGRFYEPPGEASFRVAKQADTTKLPLALAAWTGLRYDLYGPSGKLCSATLGELHVVSQYDGYGLSGVLGEDFEWVQEPDELPPARWRTPLWNSQPQWLVGDLVVVEGDCEGALWARDAALPAPTVLVPSSADNPIAKTRLAEFERSEELAELQRAYETWFSELGEDALDYEAPWAKVAAENPATVVSWSEGRFVRMIGLEFGSDNESCGSGFDAHIGSLEHVVPGGFETTEHGVDVDAIFDADGDGRWELFYSPSWDHSGMLVSETVGFEFSIDRDWECPC